MIAKIVATHRTLIQETGARLQGKAGTSGDALGAVCELMNLRQRYFASIGEHASIQDLDGINAIDELDEALLRRMGGYLAAHLAAHPANPAPPAMAAVADRLGPVIRQLPQYPVAYMVLYIVRSSFETFQHLLEGATAAPSEEQEAAFLRILTGLTDRYLQSRDRPLTRHFSGVNREYSVVSRLRCVCGQEKYEVKSQSLVTAPDGALSDRLDLICGNCHDARTILFALPYFKDMSQT